MGRRVGKTLRKKSRNAYPKLKALAWEAFSWWIRAVRDGGVCFTCGRTGDPRHMHAGHFVHGRLDFDEMNVHCQCPECNTFLDGNHELYMHMMVARYGADAVCELLQRSHAIEKRSKAELVAIVNHYLTEGALAPRKGGLYGVA